MSQPDIIGGNRRSPSELSLERALDAARIIYLYRGYLPVHTAMDLMNRGCIVEELEAQWDRESAETEFTPLAPH